MSAASIRFEIWGVEPTKISDFPDKFLIFQAEISDDLFYF